jgi:hypothetical protein
MESARWESDVARPGCFDYFMSRDNSGWRIKLRALAYPGYQFVGWSGDLSSMRNPITLVMNGPKSIRANFSRVFGSYIATQAADCYYSPGPLVLHGQVSYPIGQQMQSLQWRPALPEGWQLVAASGLGHPEIQKGDILFTGPLGYNPIQFNMIIDVPGGQTGPKLIQGEIKYCIEGVTNAISRPATGPASFSQLILPWEESPAAQLWFDATMTQPLLRIRGIVGKTYTIQLSPGFYPDTSSSPFWWSLTDLTLTNSIQSWLDESSSFTNRSTGFYRAILIQ